MKKNLWKSIYTNQIYEMPVDWLPQFGGWELVGTIEKQCFFLTIQLVVANLPKIVKNLTKVIFYALAL